jgi:hypothetical protein
MQGRAFDLEIGFQQGLADIALEKVSQRDIPDVTAAINRSRKSLG